MELEVREGQRHGIDGEVPPPQVGFHFRAEGHLRLAAIRGVGLGPVGGDLEVAVSFAESDRPEALPLIPNGISPAPHRLLGLFGGSVGSQVEVAVRIEPSQECIPHHAPHQVQPVAGGLEPGSQFCRGVDQRSESVGHGHARTVTASEASSGTVATLPA